MARLEQEDDLIRKQTLQLGRLVIDFNAERGNKMLLCCTTCITTDGRVVFWARHVRVGSVGLSAKVVQAEVLNTSKVVSRWTVY